MQLLEEEMNFNTYIRKLKEVQDKSHLENGYSHIVYQIFEIALDDEEYSIVDTSSLKRTINKATAPRDVIAVPDFVITKKGYFFDDIQKSDDILGCVEVKYKDFDVINPDRLCSNPQNKGYLEVYSKVIYTNGWIWRLYDGRQEPVEINFRKNPSNATYGELLKLLCSINWNV